MGNFNVFAPSDLTEEAKNSGVFQCPTCGLIWLSFADNSQCVYPGHKPPVHVVICEFSARVRDAI